MENTKKADILNQELDDEQLKSASGGSLSPHGIAFEEPQKPNPNCKSTADSPCWKNDSCMFIYNRYY